EKDIQLEMDGKDVELDKTIIEGLGDPLTHLVRNAVDHGIEDAKIRSAAGKPRTGTVNLTAYHEAGQVIIEVRDDGKGIDPGKIAAAAVAKGLIPAEQIKLMSDREKTALIILPGFSTAEKVTDVSGRGVGMDVVKTNIDRLGGQVDIDSRPGRGTSIRIKLPLTLAIIPCLFVSIEGNRYAIPQANVSELIRVPASKVRERIERVGDANVLILRGKMIPIVDLTEVLDMPATYVDTESGIRKADRRSLGDRRQAEAPGGSPEVAPPGQHDHQRNGMDRRFRSAGDINIVVVTTGAFEYGMVVEELHDSVEIVVKPLGRKLKHLHEYAGATIMGNGRVALILDVDGIAGAAELRSLASSSRAIELAAETQREKFQDVQNLLLFNNAPDEQCGVALDLVKRVEQVRRRDLELSAGRRVIKYRGRTLPVFTLKDVANVQQLPDQDQLVMIVFELAGKEVGLLAIPPVDAVESKILVDHDTLKQSGIMGSAIIHDRTTLMVDIHELVETLHPEWFAERKKDRFLDDKSVSVLLAEDSDFFRSQVSKYIEGEGYTVIPAEDGQRAWELLQEQGDKVKLVVTDIEMPRMDGYGLTRAIKADKRFSHLPVIAVTSLAADEDVARGKAAGIDDYQVKLDKDKLLESMHSYLQKGLAHAHA
ncbi:MAG TPA: chemotaxis protein CheW, partial [Nitrospirota bacterium]|nr:chemotaxis protein CheW [Nitrospirota bacterium]